VPPVPPVDEQLSSELLGSKPIVTWPVPIRLLSAQDSPMAPTITSDAPTAVAAAADCPTSTTAIWTAMSTDGTGAGAAHASETVTGTSSADVRGPDEFPIPPDWNCWVALQSRSARVDLGSYRRRRLWAIACRVAPVKGRTPH
jgi:hypothetical protein